MSEETPGKRRTCCRFPVIPDGVYTQLQRYKWLIGLCVSAVAFIITQCTPSIASVSVPPATSTDFLLLKASNYGIRSATLSRFQLVFPPSWDIADVPLRLAPGQYDKVPRSSDSTVKLTLDEDDIRSKDDRPYQKYEIEHLLKSRSFDELTITVDIDESCFVCPHHYKRTDRKMARDLSKFILGGMS